jgi:hypothetical protein
MKRVTALVVLGLIIFGAAAGYGLVHHDDTKQTTATGQQTNTNTDSTTKTDTPTAPTKNQTSEQQLLYLIEEEKLAHDVYTVMYQQYGTNIFGNIIDSETSHGSQVLALLKTRNIADPRSATVGVFKDPDLQALYNQLIDQGKKSLTDAYKVGVIIEEKDIADLTTQLGTTTDQDIIDVLGILRNGSENHLRAFNRQL